MSPTTTLSFPSTIAPVLDANNRWAAMRVFPASETRLDGDLLQQLGANDGDTQKLPLLIELDSIEQLPGEPVSVRFNRPLYLVLSPAMLAAHAVHDRLTSLRNQGARLMARDLPPFALSSEVSSFATDCNAANVGGIESLLGQTAGPHMASRVDSHAAHRHCVGAGFNWFSGDWALRNDAEQPAQKTTTRSNLLNLLALVATDADSHQIEALLKRDPNLSYQLLKLVNSVSFSLTHRIDSFSQAITILGRRQLQRWLQLLMYAGEHADGLVSPLLGLAAMRAALMEELAAILGRNQHEQDRAYMVGMFSLLDVLFKAPLDSLLAPLNLEEDIAKALLKHTGTLGKMLEVVVASTAASGAVLAERLAELNISAEAYLAAQLRAHAWAAEVSREI